MARFPILTLDEAKLTPALGYVFDKKWIDPRESLVSILWKLKVANALSGVAVMRLVRLDIDPYESLPPQRGFIDVVRLNEALGLPTKSLHMALIEQTNQRRYSEVFRYCHFCMVRGYHSLLHQLETASRCPAHRCPVESACRQCGHQAPYCLNVQLLEAPHRCAHCHAFYGNGAWRPDRPRPMRPDQRKAFARSYFEQGLGCRSHG
ncbi:hypothetical protein D9M68_07230 [compost metagenome]